MGTLPPSLSRWGLPTGSVGTAGPSHTGDVRGLERDSGHRGATLSGPNFILLLPTGSFYPVSELRPLLRRTGSADTGHSEARPVSPRPCPPLPIKLPQRTEQSDAETVQFSFINFK